MRDEGIVLVIRGDHALVRMSGKSGCEGCSSCSTTSGCNVELEALTTEGVVAGSRVVVEVSSVGAAVSAVLVFVLPLLGLVAGVLVGSQLGGTGGSLGLGFGALIVFFGLAVLVERRIVQPRLPEPTIVSVLQRPQFPDSRLEE